MLEIAHLSVQYTTGRSITPVLADLSLSLPPGAIYTLIGPSGCGKSTLLHTLGGLLPPVAGSIRLNGLPLNPKRHTIGLVPQNYSLLAWKTVRENILLACRVRRQSYAPAFLSELLEVLALTPLLERYPAELSGGQRQRAAIARVFLLQPELLLMDEPFSALDALTRERLQKLFLHLWQKNPATTLFVTHSIEEAVYLGQKILLLSPLPQQSLQCFDNPYFLHSPAEDPLHTARMTRLLHRKLQEVPA